VEDRLLLATFVVNSTGDGSDINPGDGLCVTATGECTLRAAIEEANALAGTDAINFNIDGGGVQRIAPTSELPIITGSVIIDGYTQPGAQPNSLVVGNNAVLMIEVDGTNAGAGVDGLTITAGNSTVQGLVINRFRGGGGIARPGGGGIVLSVVGGNTVRGNVIGTDATGALQGLGNSSGIIITIDGNTVGGATNAARNLISGNSNSGVVLANASETLLAARNVIQGNYIGTNASGTSSVNNGQAGVFITSGASDNTIGGTATGAGNLISGNGNGSFDFRSGIVIFTLGTRRNVIQGNLIGTDATGTLSLGNGVESLGDGTGIDIFDNAADNTIGGVVAAARNIISGNFRTGVRLQTDNAQGNLIQGNYIGTDVTGDLNRGNRLFGIEIRSAPRNTVGGTSPGARNIISGSLLSGVAISGDIATGNLLQGNFIGTNASGSLSLGNQITGVEIASAPGNTIGGTASGAGNVISGNIGNGVFLSGVVSTSILGNFIGTDSTGTTSVPNGNDGVAVTGGSFANVIGGTTAGSQNIISGNTGSGISLRSIAGALTFDGQTAGFGPDPFFAGTPKGTSPITDQFTSRGVLFSIDANGVDYVSSPNFVGGSTGPSGGNFLAVNSFSTSTPTTLTARFVNPATGNSETIEASTFSVFVSDINPVSTPGVIVRTFSDSGQLLEEQGIVGLGETLRFSVGRIARVEFFDNGGDGFAIDNFTFQRPRRLTWWQATSSAPTSPGLLPWAISEPVSSSTAAQPATLSAEQAVSGSNIIAFNGSGLVVMGGPGTTNQTGNNANSQATIINSGTLQVIAPDAIPSTSAVMVASGATLDLNSFNDAIGSLSGAGAVILGTGTLTTGVDNSTTPLPFSGAISGSGGVTKQGSGTFTLSGMNTYTGATAVNAGSLRVDGSLAMGSPVTVNGGGLLEGTGTVGGTLLANPGASVAPGTASTRGILSTGSLTLTAGSTIFVDLNGPYILPGSDYDRFVVTGAVNLGSANLVLSGGAAAPPPGAVLVLTLIQNDGTDPIVGTFSGLPEGAPVTVGLFTGVISYVGGDGNDVALNVVPTVSLSLSGSNLPENGGLTTVTATLSDISPLDVTVDLGFSGTASLGGDYSPSATSIVIPAGSLSVASPSPQSTTP
jgi:CSLREA domain-containing protein